MLCFWLKICFLPWGLIVAWMVSDRTVSELCSVCHRSIKSALGIDDSCILVTQLYVLKSLFWKTIPYRKGTKERGSHFLSLSYI